MNKLLRIEFKKIDLKAHIKLLFLTNIILIPIIYIAVRILEADPSITIDSIFIADTAVKSILIVWQSILVSSVVIEEYKSKIMMQLYTYTVKRTSIIHAKLLLIWIIMIVFHLITQIIQQTASIALDSLLPSYSFIHSVNIQNILIIAFTTITTIMLGMIPFAIGIWTKSLVAPVVTAIAIISFATNGTFSSEGSIGLVSQLGASAILGAIGLIIGLISTMDNGKKDLNV